MSHASPRLASAQPAPPVQASSPQVSTQQLPAQPQIAQPAPTAQPQTAIHPAFANILPTAAPTAAAQTHREKLNAGDLHWQYKVGLRAILIITGIIGVGCTAWITSKYATGKGPYEYDLDDSWTMPWSLITFAVSVIWSAICILVFFLRRPNAPVHPGAQVGIDLILWLGFVGTALLAVSAVMSVKQFGEDGIISGYSSGYYDYIASNNTWVYNATDDSSYYSSRRSCNHSSSRSSYNYYNDYTFKTCAEEDAYVNQLWQGKDKRYNTELTATVCQFIGLLLHFALFVWACVDTHRRNSRKVSKEAEALASEIVMNMVKNGAIIQAPGATQTRPMHAQMATQTQMYSQPYPQQWPLQQQPIAGPSNEKGDAARFA